MDAHGMRSELFEQAQHLYRRREELDARIEALDPIKVSKVITLMSLWERLPDDVGELIYALIEMELDELTLVGQLGPGWRKTERGVAFFPVEGSPDA